MPQTPDGRAVYICPTCNGAAIESARRAGRDGSSIVEEDCRTCDGSGQIVGGPA